MHPINLISPRAKNSVAGEARGSTTEEDEEEVAIPVVNNDLQNDVILLEDTLPNLLGHSSDIVDLTSDDTISNFVCSCVYSANSPCDFFCSYHRALPVEQIG